MPAHTTGCPPVAQREDPGRPPWEGADVLRPYGATYGAAYRVPPRHHKVMHDIMVCRTAALGGHAEQCPQYGFERYAYHSCRHRPCPTCQTMTKAQWVEDRQAALLPGPYCHCVCTLPHALKALVLVNKRPLLTLLLRTASQTLLQFGRQNLGGQLGGIPVLHTWDQTLGAHFHVHCLVPGGALADKGTRWLPTHPRFLLPVHALRTVFRGKCLEALHFTTMGTLGLPEETETLATPAGFRRFIDQLYAKAWVVYAKQALAGPGHVLDYLSRSTHRVAIANHRIVDVQDGPGRLTYRNRRQGHRVQTMTLEAHECIRRFLLHVVP
jgi:putative transposase/transposase-like zinc-binding protein